MPTTGEPAPLDATSPRADEKASAGLYSVTLARYAIGVEITAARRSAIYRFSYPRGAQANLLFDVAHCLLARPAHGESQSLTGSEIKILSPTEIAGSTSVTGGWNKQPNSYTVYFYARTDTPAASWGTWLDGKLQPGSKSVQRRGEDQRRRVADLCQPRRPAGADEDRHFIHQRGAGAPQCGRRNSRLRFRGYARRCPRQWDRALANVELKGETAEQAQIFYTALYHTMLDAHRSHRRKPALEVERALLRRLLRHLGYLPHLRAACSR